MIWMNEFIVIHAKTTKSSVKKLEADGHQSQLFAGNYRECDRQKHKNQQKKLKVVYLSFASGPCQRV